MTEKFSAFTKWLISHFHCNIYDLWFVGVVWRCCGGSGLSVDGKDCNGIAWSHVSTCHTRALLGWVKVTIKCHTDVIFTLIIVSVWSVVMAGRRPAGSGFRVPHRCWHRAASAQRLHRDVQTVPHDDHAAVGPLPARTWPTQLRHAHFLPRAHRHLQVASRQEEKVNVVLELSCLKRKN